jgi:hypothetical protein
MSCKDCGGARPCLKCAPSMWYPAPSGSRAAVMEALARRVPRCKGCGKEMRPLCRTCVACAYRISSHKLIVAGLRAAIADHGPITRSLIGSAAKRIESMIEAQLRDEIARNAFGASRTGNQRDYRGDKD